MFETEHRGHRLVAEMDYFDWRERVNLYRDGVLLGSDSSPARIDVDEGTRLEAAMTLYGMKHVRLVASDGSPVTDLRPSAGTGEAWRRRLAEEHPRVSTALAVTSWTVLVVALVTQVPELLGLLGRVGGFTVPTFALPDWLNPVLGVAGVLAGLERALRLAHSPWLDD